MTPIGLIPHIGSGMPLWFIPFRLYRILENVSYSCKVSYNNLKQISYVCQLC